MAGKGLVIPMSLDPREWIRGVRVVERTLEDMQDELEDVEDAGERLGRKLEDAFDEASRGARDYARKIDDVGDEIGDVEGEAAQSAKEFGAAFRGDPVEALEEVQSYLAEIVSVKLPGFAGALATIAGGAAFGFILSKYEEWKQKQEEINETAGEFAAELADAGGALDTLIEKSLAANVLAEQNVETRMAIARAAADAGVSEGEYVAQLLQGRDIEAEIGELRQQRQQLADESLGASRDEQAVMQVQDQLLLQQIEDRKKIAEQLGVQISATEKTRDYERERNALADGLAREHADMAEEIWRQARGISDANAKLETQLRRVQDIRWEVDRIPRSVTVNVINKQTRTGLVSE